MKVIGIDQSYTGFGYSTEGVSLKKTFPAPKYAGPIDRLDGIRHWFTGWMKNEVAQDRRNIDLVVMEGYANGAKVGREMAGELGGVVKLAIRDTWGSDPLIVPPTSLKKFVTGKGNAKKNEMLLGVYKQWGKEFSDDNQADAFALEMFGHAYIMQTEEPEWVQQAQYLTKYQIEAIEKVRHPT